MKNYYTAKNKFLSCSKLKDYLKDPRFFYEKHILHTREQEPSIALDIGRGVDTYVMDGPKAFQKKFKCVERRNLKEPPKGFTQLNQSDYTMVVAMGEKVRSQTAFKEIQADGFWTQQILQIDAPVGVFSGLCGIPDWMKIDGDTATIIDLKTTGDISQRAYERSCKTYMYPMQLSFYSYLIEQLYGIKKFIYKHLAVEKDRDGVYECKTFEFDQKLMKQERDHLMYLLNLIDQEKEFKAREATWEKSLLIL